MDKRMDLDSFNVYTYIKNNYTEHPDKHYVLTDHRTYQDAAICFPIRNFFFSIGLIYQPGVIFRVGSRQYQTRRGSLVTIGPGIVSQWQSDSPDVPADAIMFQEELLIPLVNTVFWASLPFFLPGGNHVMSLSEEEMANVTCLFGALKQFREEPDLVAGLTYSLLMLVRKIHDGADTDRNPAMSVSLQLVQAFHRLVAQEFLTKKDVAYYASRLHVTPKYLSEVLQTHTNRSAKTIIEDTIFLEAKSLLRQTGMSVQEICYYLGYADTSYFTKAFRNREGVTPSAYRKQ